MTKPNDVDAAPLHGIVMRFSRWLSSEVKADVYDGPNADQHRNYFHTFCVGDKDSDDHSDPIVLKATDLPPGTMIHVEMPECPECGIVRQDIRQHENGAWAIIGFADKCDCGFDWRAWTEDEYA